MSLDSAMRSVVRQMMRVAGLTTAATICLSCSRVGRVEMGASLPGAAVDGVTAIAKGPVAVDYRLFTNPVDEGEPYVYTVTLRNENTEPVAIEVYSLAFGFIVRKAGKPYYTRTVCVLPVVPEDPLDDFVILQPEGSFSYDLEVIVEPEVGTGEAEIVFSYAPSKLNRELATEIRDRLGCRAWGGTELETGPLPIRIIKQAK